MITIKDRHGNVIGKALDTGEFQTKLKDKKEKSDSSLEKEKTKEENKEDKQKKENEEKNEEDKDE